MRLGRWCFNFEIAGNNEQNSGGGCSEWANGKLWEVAPCVHQGAKTDTSIQTQIRYMHSHKETQRQRGYSVSIESFHFRGVKAQTGDSRFLSSVMINQHSLMLCCYGTKTVKESSVHVCEESQSPGFYTMSMSVK